MRFAWQVELDLWFAGCLGSTFYALHASRVAFRVPPPSGDLLLETLTPFILNKWPSSCAATIFYPFCFKWLCAATHNLEAFSVCCDSSGFRGRSCSCAATISWLFHKCIQDIIFAAVYYCIFRVQGPEAG